eukprot:2329148-Pyramimonas_sp.AAC.1
MRVQQLRWFAVPKSQTFRFGTIQDRQDASARLIRGVGIPRTMFWCLSGSSNRCLPTRQFPQWKCTVVGGHEEGDWRE